jgi:hypothetical protein
MAQRPRLPAARRPCFRLGRRTEDQCMIEQSRHRRKGRMPVLQGHSTIASWVGCRRLKSRLEGRWPRSPPARTGSRADQWTTLPSAPLAWRAPDQAAMEKRQDRERRPCADRVRAARRAASAAESYRAPTRSPTGSSLPHTQRCLLLTVVRCCVRTPPSGRMRSRAQQALAIQRSDAKILYCRDLAVHMLGDVHPRSSANCGAVLSTTFSNML